ncbi:MAG: fatty acid desaturase [Marinobacter sp.]|nr:fatty acid desaturase [Marinobacter sp.]
MALWLDSEAYAIDDDSETIDWIRCIPFGVVHLACLLAIFMPVNASLLWLCLFSYGLRMFAITGFYHRYFSHKAFQTHRVWQFVFALLGLTAVQRGPLWWAAHHRAHHQHSDTQDDVHSPRTRSLLWSHLGWFICNRHFKTDYDRVKDFARYPELRFLNRHDQLVPLLTGVLVFATGEWCYSYDPTLGIQGLNLLLWAFLIPTVLVWHATFSINSLAHLLGRRRFNTRDHSRNNFLLALFTLGEGWHNNHHRWPTSARQGFYWWEIDVTYYLLKLLSMLRIIHSLNPVPPHVLQRRNGD